MSAVGTTWNIEWVKIDDPEATTQTTLAQGFAKGGARFRWLEGAWWSVSTGYVLATTGGTIAAPPGGEGQVFEFNPFKPDDQADLQLADRARLREPGQPHGDAARRPADVRGQLRFHAQRRRTPDRADADGQHVYVRHHRALAPRAALNPRVPAA